MASEPREVDWDQLTEDLEGAEEFRFVLTARASHLAVPAFPRVLSNVGVGKKLS